MTVRTLTAGTPPLPLQGGYFLRLEAIDPTTGAAVTGVTVSDVAIYGRSRATGTLDLEELIGPWVPDEVVEAEA